MLITFELSDEDVRELQAAGVDPARRAREALLSDLDRKRGQQSEREQPHDAESDWDLLDNDTRERFTAKGLTAADFDAAARGVRPLPRSNEDRKFAERIRDAKNTEPNMVLHREDIVFVMCGDEEIPTLRHFVSDEQGLAHLDKMRAQWEREWSGDPQAFSRGLQGLHQKREVLFDELTSRFGEPGGASEALGGGRRISQRT